MAAGPGDFELSRPLDETAKSEVLYITTGVARYRYTYMPNLPSKSPQALCEILLMMPINIKE